MPACALGGLHNDVATAQLDGGIAIAHGDREFSPLVHLNQRAVTQAQHGVRCARSPDLLTIEQLVADLEQLFAIRAYAIQNTVKSFHLCSHTRWAGKEF